MLEDADRFIREHTKISWLIWVLAWAFLIPAANLAPLHEPTRFGFMAWFTAVELLTTPLAVVALGRAAERRGMPAVALPWVMAQVPLIASFAALFDRAPQWLGTLAFVEAIALMIYSTRRGRKGRIQEAAH